MKAKLVLAAAALAAAVPLAAQPPAPTDTAAPRTMEQLIPDLDRAFETFQRERPTPGLIYGIVENGRLVHVRSFGVQDIAQRRPVGTDTLFRIASMSKAFTALAILKLRDEGKLRLDDLAERYVPEMRGWRYPTSDSPRIRVRDLLAHTGGLVTDDPWGDRQQVLTPAEFTRMIAEGPAFTRAPQLAMEYSNYGYALLGRIITNASGRPYQRYITDEIMRPLGMTSTGYDVTAAPRERRAIGYRWEDEAWSEEPTMRDGEFGAMGGVQTSANDYAKWMAFLLSAWPARDGPETGPVKRATVREMAQGLNYPTARPLPGRGGSDGCPMALAYGMGFTAGSQCELGRLMFHGGGYPGYGSFLLLLPDHGTGIFAFSNRTYAGPIGPVFGAAESMQRAGLLGGRAIATSDALASAYRAAGAMYRAGNLTPGKDVLAMNFLMDRAEGNWAREFTRLKNQVGECRTDAPFKASGALAGEFEWQCQRGKIQGQILLAPTRQPGIQALRFNPMPAAAPPQ